MIKNECGGDIIRISIIVIANFSDAWNNSIGLTKTAGTRRFGDAPVTAGIQP
jgi:hypothetical protein